MRKEHILFRLKLLITIFVTSLLLNSCIDPIEPPSLVEFENALVVEATITNELKEHQVFLTRTFKLVEGEAAAAESNANVVVIAGGQSLAFSESSPGVYTSDQAFSAEPNIEYTLAITTQNGSRFNSNIRVLTQNTPIGDLRADRIVDDTGGDGIAIRVDSFDPTGNSKNYRYEYEETYEIIAPFFRPLEIIPLVSPEPCQVELVPKSEDLRQCFATDFSTDIILTNTSDLDEDRVADFVVRFIKRDNFIISHRYSILVRQFVESNEAFVFYETLDELSSSESLFSETQPGFIVGNISPEDDASERVIGFFDISFVDEKRIFFDYEDFYPGEDLPPYVDPCEAFSPPLKAVGPAGHGDPVCILSRLAEENLITFFQDNLFPGRGEGPYDVVPKVCGDCSVLGEPEMPDFWIE